MTLEDRCFICGLRISRGHQPSLTTHDRINKLVSVSKTVEHSSTIISDILSRILNETVMNQEAICRICFNLLNDIDYHLKEAQEKTDEITNKFLVKGKDALRYPTVGVSHDPLTLENQLQDPCLTENRLEESFTLEEDERASSSKKLKEGDLSRKRTKGQSREFFQSPYPEAETHQTDDEMSVNTINKNKAKLLSHVLNPRSKVRHESQSVSKKQAASHSVSEHRAPSVRSDNTDSDEESEPNQHLARKRHRRKDDNSRGKNKVKSTREAVSERRFESSPEKQDSTTVFFAIKSDPPVLTQGSVIKCHVCKKQFRKESNLQLHIEKKHSEKTSAFTCTDVVPETHKCSRCPREFTNKKSLEIHQEEHQNVIVQTVPRVQVQQKSETTEKENIKATCKICGKHFRRHFNLKTHIDRVHNKIKPFSCKICSKSFATKSDLSQHMNTHGQGKTFQCDQCDRSFTNRDSILLHIKQHTKTHTHFCPTCNKGFYKASCLTRHMRTHTGERPYKCDICNKGFTQSTTLKTHRNKCFVDND